jgi:hypothetical protein
VFAITHPCFKAPATGEITDHVDGSVRRTVGRYFDEGYWDGPGAHAAAFPVGAYHRTLSRMPCLLHARCRMSGAG